MWSAGLWGAVGASSLLIGAVIGLLLPLPRLAIGLILGFGAGTLISAVSFELTDEAYRLGGADAVVIGLTAGALTYFVGDVLVERRGGSQRMSPQRDAAAAGGAALLLGAVLDGIAESAVIGLTLLDGGSVGVPVLAAVFISNLPESISSSSGMRAAGSTTRHVLVTWGLVVLVSAASAAAGYGLLQDASGNTVALIDAFAGGAVI